MTQLRFLSVAAALLGVVAGADARAQSTAAPSAASATTAGADARWTPWLGCWRAVDDPASTGARVCVTAANGGVTLRTIVAGQSVSEESRNADGTPRPVRESGCTGTETTRWSADGLRAYRTAQASCGAEAPRTLAGVVFFVASQVWVDVQTVAHDGTTDVRVTRYTRASNQRLADGTLVPQPAAGRVSPLVSRGWTTDQVLEASRWLPADGVQAAIGEGFTAFRLNARSLAQLADGGVAEGVIDLMVALTYPEKFVVERSADRGGAMGSMVDIGWADPFFSQIVGPAALYNCYSPYGWASASYWSGCSGYDSYRYQSYPGYYNGYYGLSNGGWITTQGAPSGGAPQSEGRLVNGRGYTQIRPVDTSIVGMSSGRSDGTSTTSSTSSSGGTSSGGATSSGYSGGGGGDRTAVPRPPGC